MTTMQHRIALLEKYGFTVGDRDARLNARYPGNYMVVEANAADIGDYELPTEDGANGPWCIVGDDLEAIVVEAHQYLLDMGDAHNGIEAEWARISELPAEALPPRQNYSLYPAPALG